MRRDARAMDRAILAIDSGDRARAQQWARAWHACAYVRLDILVRLNSIADARQQR